MLDVKTRLALGDVAYKNLMTTEPDGTKWSSLWASDTRTLSFCAYDEFPDFDGSGEDLDLSWPEERRKLIFNTADEYPTDAELADWQRAMATSAAMEATEQACTGWVVTVDDGVHHGLAFFSGSNGAAPEDEPLLEGVFESLAEIEDYLTHDRKAVFRWV